ncbi:MAG: ferritin-like domain-containing protein [Cyanobacteria bacterium P01_A01_bin.105]
MPRRQLVKLGLFTGATSAIAIAAPRPAAAKHHFDNDIKIFNEAAMLEQRAINTYVAAAENGLLPTQAFLDVAVEFAGDHTEHRDRLKLIVRDVFKGEPANTEGLGTFPIPDNVLNGSEADVLRYALTLEMLAAKAYLNNIRDNLTTSAGKNVAASIMPIETQHVAVYRTVLKTLLNTDGLPGDGSKIVPFAFLSTQPTPAVPTGTTL